MKTVYKFFIAASLLAATLLQAGCNDILEEEPKTVFTVKYFQSVDGLESAIVAAYAGMRYHYGPMGACDISCFGTDEWTNGDQAINEAMNVYNMSPSTSAILTPWNRSFPYINLCNAVIKFAPNVSMSEPTRVRIIAEARYLRAHYYYILVSQFGAVPLNLGSGELEFNENPTSEFFRLPVDELLVKNYQAIIDDFKYASENLPDQRPVTSFRLSKAAALHMLAKSFLLRAYSTASQSTDMSNAYGAAMEIIDNQSKYGVTLLPDFADVHKENNDYNAEAIYSVERLPLNNSANEVNSPGSDFGNKSNYSVNGFNCNYQQAVPSGYYNAALAGKVLFDSRVLAYGRPLRRFAPTLWLTETAFADKTNDSRFDNSFRNVWYAATYYAEGTSQYKDYLAKIADMGVSLGDTLAYIAKTDAEATYLKGLTGDAQKKYYIVAPSETFTNANRTIQWYPCLKKFASVKRANFNDVSGRPFMVSRLGETYLLAAEAVMGTDKAKAAELINVLKKRAVYRTVLAPEQIDARYDQIKVSSSDVTLDLIMDERARELCGETYRWSDLATRGILLPRVNGRNVDAVNIQPHHALRPIPQSQFDASILNGDISEYQNPGYY
ncbi:MAG: RagB/SusD family nutrient uptake outer membrane protein [Breznakibacter sp.]